jgi:hypothetical protein
MSAMTTITIDLPDPQAEKLAAKARAQGMTLEDWFRQVAAKEAEAPAVPAQVKRDPEEWARRIDEWMDSHDPNTPVLPDEAMRRDSIYPDRS